ncbi:MAG: hypothetical protein IPP17_24800 [Bacteroidetes bacterium]|nr:hypothetical protein [Bacteroidota bacterium]
MQPMKGACKRLEGCKQIISLRQITEVRAIATSAIRSASNGQSFVAAVKSGDGHGREGDQRQ